jgi:hypothetical protein
MPFKSLDYASRETHPGIRGSSIRTASYTVFAVALLLLFANVFSPRDYKNGETGRYVARAFPLSVVLSATGIALAAGSLATRRGGWIALALNSALLSVWIFFIVRALRSPMFPGG